MSKLNRRNQNRQRQLEKQKEHRLEASIFAGRDGAPRNVAIISLCNDCDSPTAVRALNNSLDIEATVKASGGVLRVPVERFKQQLQYIIVPPERDVLASLDAARAADFVVFLLSATEEVDERGELILRGVGSQGLSTLFTAVQGMDSIEQQKQRLSVLESLKSFMKHFHPDQDKIFSLENRQECSNLIRSLCSATPKGIHWRDERSWMLVEGVQFGSTEDDAAAVLTGVVRGRGLKADRLVQIGEWGTFQVDKITAAPLSAQKPKAADNAAESMAVDSQGTGDDVLDMPTEDRDDLTELAPEGAELSDSEDDDMEDDAVDGRSLAASSRKGVLLDDHHYFSDEDGIKPAKKLPKGTSEYQSAWILDDVTSESESDMDDDEDDKKKDGGDATEMAEPADGMEGIAQYAPTEAGGGQSEYPQSEAYFEEDDEKEAEQLALYRSQKRTEAEDDLEFPDEIELQPNVLARERLERYRGLKSLRSSPWNEKEDRPHEPEDWRRLLRIPDYKSSRIRTTREALVGGVAPGTRVSVHLARGVLIPEAVRAAYDPSKPVTLFSLFRHENKQTVVNYLFNMSADERRPLKAKEEIIVQCGPRRFVAKPLYSQSGVTPNNVHKFCRYLHPGQSAVASFVGPVTWGTVPTLFFKRVKESSVRLLPGVATPPDLKLLGTGTALPPSTSRVVAKRVILTGHPYHIHKKIVTIRYMFFNREDVEWFKALPLWTKRGRSGFIKECLGTHGYFKATFDGRINPQDSVGVSLYKRVWPRKAAAFQSWAATPTGPEPPEGDDMDEEMV